MLGGETMKDDQSTTTGFDTFSPFETTRDGRKHADSQRRGNGEIDPPCIAAARLVDQIGREAAAQEMFWKPSRASGVVSHVFADWPAPCHMTIGYFRGFTGSW